MKRKEFTIECGDEVGGVAVFASSTTEAELQKLVPEISLYGDADACFVASAPGPVQLVGVTPPLEDCSQRVYVGLVNRRSKKIRLMPSAGQQVARLQARLHDVPYDEQDHDAADLSDIAKRMAVNTQLVQAFGSTRRVRQLSQKAEGRLVAENVIAHSAMAAAIAEMGKQALEQGYTTAAVMAKVSAERLIPVHNLAAPTAALAYVFSALASKTDCKHLEVAFLAEAMCDKGQLEKARGVGGRSTRIDPFVEYVLSMKHAAAAGNKGSPEVTESCSWLALYNNCRKVARIRSGTKIVHEEIGPDEDDIDSLKAPRQVTMESLARQHGFFSAAAAEWLLAKYGHLDEHAGVTTYTVSMQQEHLLKTTLAVCAVRANGHVVTAEMGVALLKSMNPTPPQEVMNLLREVGCKVTAVKNQKVGSSFTASLLGTSDTGKTLADVLPVLKRRQTAKKG